MKLAELITYFQIKNMIVRDSVITGGCVQLHDHDSRYAVRRMRVKKDDFQHAIILYRKKNNKFTLINIDLFYSRLSSTIPSRVYVEGASLAKLERDMCT